MCGGIAKSGISRVFRVDICDTWFKYANKIWEIALGLLLYFEITYWQHLKLQKYFFVLIVSVRELNSINALRRSLSKF